MSIISHSRRFIFLKTRKTAGSSIEIALAPLCDQGDTIVTSGDAEDYDLPRRVSQRLDTEQRTAAQYVQYAWLYVRDILKSRRSPNLTKIADRA